MWTWLRVKLGIHELVVTFNDELSPKRKAREPYNRG